MDQQKALLVERLRAAPSPRDVHDWKGRDGYYVAACRAAADDVPRLVDIARRWTDWDWPGNDDELDIDPDDAELLPVTAWRTLADLRADGAVEPLIEMLRESGDEFDDWISEDLPHVFGKIGAASIEPLIRVAHDAGAEELVRSVAVRSLRYVADYHTQTRDRIVAILTEMMAAAAGNDADFNSTLLVELVDLHAVDAAEPIERAFAGNRIDVGMMGNWEEVRKQLGVEGLGLKMPEKPYNSMNQFRARMGIGVFSDRPLFKYDEIDHDAEQAYYRRAWDTFSKSREAQEVVDRYGDVGWFRTLLEFGLNYLGESVDVMTLESVKDFVLDYFPRKVSTEPDKAASIVGELTSFWEYLDRVYELPEAKPIVEWLKTDRLVSRLKAELSDTSNFGMAKSFVMMGKNAGYDMTSQAGMDAFMVAYNRSLLASKSPPPASPAPPLPPSPAARPVAAKQKVGRNDPCPCGSGKKFKKCCL